MSRPQPTLHELRRHREHADMWIERARLTAMFTAGIGVLACLVLGIERPAAWPRLAALLTGFLAQGLIGHSLLNRSQWNAWGLLASYVVTFVLSVFVYGVWSGIVVKVGIAYVYFRGFLGTLDYEETTAQIAQLSQNPPADAA